MKTYRMLAVATAIALAAAGLAGCASTSGKSGGTVALENSSNLQGRDVGRGGATSGGISSLDPSGNAADWSIYDARQLQQQ
ncbi:MAG: hypothetical protein ABSE62_08425 [Chthoniobacteraceae bacterium]|jgi:hypothetical protein